MEEESKKIKRFDEITFKEKGILYIPDNVLAQINYLHSHVGKTEWSGMLFYDVVQGSPSDPKNFILKAKYIYPMDIGTSGYTEYSPDGDLVDIYDAIEEAMEWKIGHIHSHHSMETFFSGTDTDELHTNVDKHNYYLSLIVNFSSRYTAKVAFLSDSHITSKFSYIDDAGVKKHFKKASVSKTMVTIDMIIMYEKGLNEFFFNSFRNLQKKAEKAKIERQKAFDATQSSFDFSRSYSPALKGKGYEGSVDEMSTSDVEKLTRNILSVTPKLTEVRGSYQLLSVLKSSREDEMEVYYKLLYQSLQDIIENFFDQELDKDEMKTVLSEVSQSLMRFKTYSEFREIINGIESIFVDFLTYYNIEEEDDTKEVNGNVEEELEEEIKSIT